MVLDQLRILAWLQSKDGAKGKNRPKPMSPLVDANKAKGGRKWGRTDRPAEEVAGLLQRVAEGEWSRPASRGGTVVTRKRSAIGKG